VGVGDLFQKLLDNLKACWPIRVIESNQGGVKRSRGKKPKYLGPGVRWFIPGLESIEVVEIAYQEIDCGIQSMVSKDNVPVSFSTNVGYTISDASQMSESFYNFDTTLRNMVRGQMADAVMNNTYAELQANLPVVLKGVRRALRRSFARSVRIKTVRLDEFVPSKQFRLLGAMQIGG